MKTGVRWPFLAVLGVLVVVSAGKLWWLHRELTLKPGLAYDQDRSLLPRFLTSAPAEERAAKRAFQQAYTAWKAAPPKLAQRPGTALSAAVRAQWAEMLTTSLVDAWRQGGKSAGQPPECEQLLRARGAMLGDPPDHATEALARGVLARGLDDPLIASVAGDVLLRGGDYKAASPASGQVRQLIAAGCSPRLTFWLAGRSAAGDIDPDTVQTTLAEALRGEFAPGELRLLWAVSPVESCRNLYDKPGLDPWYFHMLAGVEQLRYDRPGSTAPAGDEPPDIIARRHLLLAWHLHPDWPEAATRLITLANAHPTQPGEARFWFDQAVACEFDYAPAYMALREALMVPQPQPQPSALLAFGRECLSTGRLDTRVPDEVWPTMATAAAAEQTGTAVDWTTLEPYADLSHYFAARLAETTDKVERARQRARWAAVAKRLDQPAEALTALAGGPARDDSTEYDQLCDSSPNALAAWAAAATTLGQPAAEAEAAWREQRWVDAATRYTALAVTAIGAARTFVQQRAATATALGQLAAGQPVVIQPNALPDAWELAEGRLSLLPGGVLRLSTAEPVELRFAALLRPPFTLRCEYRGATGEVRPGIFLLEFAGAGPSTRGFLGDSLMSDRAWARLEVTQSGRGQSVRGDNLPSYSSPVAAGAKAPDCFRLRLRSADCPLVYEPTGAVRIEPGSRLTPPAPPRLHRLPADQVWWELRGLTLLPSAEGDGAVVSRPGTAAPGPAVPPAPTPHSGR